MQNPRPSQRAYIVVKNARKAELRSCKNTCADVHSYLCIALRERQASKTPKTARLLLSTLGSTTASLSRGEVFGGGLPGTVAKRRAFNGTGLEGMLQQNHKGL